MVRRPIPIFRFLSMVRSWIPSIRSPNLNNSFTGTQLVVAGSQLVPNELNLSGGTCTVDGVTQQISYTTQNATNRVGLCRYQSLTSGQHTLVLNAVPAGGKPFWFDYLRYLPTPSAPTINEYVQVLPGNGNLSFDATWATETPDDVIQITTRSTNATMSYAFVGKPLINTYCSTLYDNKLSGTSISWYGSYNHSTSLHPANLSYAVDQAEPTVVEILPSTKAQFNITMQQVIFNASGLAPGVTHDLKVTYLGNPQSVPLSLNSLLFTWGPLLDSSHNSSGATPSISVSRVFISPRCALLYLGTYLST